VAFEFFLKEARKRRLNDLDEWHKYPLSETQSRLRDTVLLSKWSEIETFINRDKKILERLPAIVDKSGWGNVGGRFGRITRYSEAPSDIATQRQLSPSPYFLPFAPAAPFPNGAPIRIHSINVSMSR
jgi:hypothetical protein